MGTPKYLYHYTTVETLALILKNRTIRFRSLDQMDDLQECMAHDLKKAGEFILISSWTNKRKEHIPMWKMYGSLENGVRIRLRANPFKSHPQPPNMVGHIIYGKSYEGQKCLIPLEDMERRNFLARSSISGDILKQVIYTEKKDELYPEICQHGEGNSVKISLNKLGIYKSTYWKFQSEWRYIIEVIPFSTMPIRRDDLKKTANSIIDDNAQPPFSYYDMEIDDEAFINMEITLSPGISKGNEVIVHLLKEKYNPTAKIIRSTLDGLIK